MNNKEIASLTLKTSVLSAGSTNAYGTMNATYSDMTFTGINLRACMGSMIDKYSKFNLILNSMGTTNMGNAFGNTDDRGVMVVVEGLNFINNYSNDGTASHSASIAYYLWPASGLSNNNYFFNNCIATFTRPASDIRDIRIYFAPVGGTALNTTYVNTFYMFDIVPVEE